MKKFSQHIISIGLLSLLFSTLALAEGNYAVEMIVFKQANNNTNEIWHDNLELGYPASTRNIPDVMASDSRELTNIANKISGRGNRILFHKRWKQYLYSPNRAKHLLVVGGKRNGEHNELEGTIKLSKQRYLHLQTNLWLSSFDGDAPFGDLSHKLPARPSRSNDVSGIVSSIAPMNEKRRMRSNEVHYIDHPLYGVIIKITPL